MATYPRPTYHCRGWHQRRAHHLRLEPLCRFCRQQGRIEPATVADHVQPWRKASDPAASFWLGELQSLCKCCHDGAKQSLERTGRLRGSTINGLPLDPQHPWFREAEA